MRSPRRLVRPAQQTLALKEKAGGGQICGVVGWTDGWKSSSSKERKTDELSSQDVGKMINQIISENPRGDEAFY